MLWPYLDSSCIRRNTILPLGCHLLSLFVALPIVYHSYICVRYSAQIQLPPTHFQSSDDQIKSPVMTSMRDSYPSSGLPRGRSQRRETYGTSVLAGDLGVDGPSPRAPSSTSRFISHVKRSLSYGGQSKKHPPTLAVSICHKFLSMRLSNLCSPSAGSRNALYSRGESSAFTAFLQVFRLSRLHCI